MQCIIDSAVVEVQDLGADYLNKFLNHANATQSSIDKENGYDNITLVAGGFYIIFYCHKVKHIFYMIPIFEVMKNNLSFGIYSTCTLVF